MVTLSSTTFTIADDARPPTAQYAMATAPPARHPCHFGSPITTASTQEIAINCPARIASVPNHSITAITAFTDLW